MRRPTQGKQGMHDPWVNRFNEAALIRGVPRRSRGLKHFLSQTEKRRTAVGVPGPGFARRYGGYGMALLANGFLNRGGSPRRHMAKRFGGAKVVAKLSDAGNLNVVFAPQNVKSEGVELISMDLRGRSARWVQSWLGSGRARTSYLRSEDKAALGLQEISGVARRSTAAGHIELFR